MRPEKNNIFLSQIPFYETFVSDYFTLKSSEVAMKRVKRANTNEHAYKLGRLQGQRGHDEDICPYSTLLDQKQHWRDGWVKGHTERLLGYRIDD